jgi:hypothetical protein
MTKMKSFSCIAVLTMIATALHAEVAVVNGPDVTQTNRFYVSNRAPLLPSQFIGLPVGSVEPRGWLREMLKRQREGLTGHLGEISAWLQKEDNAWLSKSGKGKYGWEELPYWLKGYIELAYLFNDPKMIAECHVWIEGTLASQRPNGDFGPDERFGDDGSRDYWANMVMLYCLQSYHERTGDPRVLELMTRYFKYQMSVPDDKMLTHYWQKMRGGDNIFAIHWLYNRTGDPQLLALAEKIHRCTANWKMKDDLPNWHNVNIAECFREPAQMYLQTHDQADLQAAYANHFEIRKRFGQVPGGMFGGDENCRVGYDDPRQATETCGFVEQMLSDEMMLQISGDPFWADHCEEIAFNSYPAAVMPDFKSLRYLTAPNMVVSDSMNHAPGIDNRGPFLMMNPFSSRCCQHNHSHGWPYFSKSLWMATPDNGVLAALYSASEVKVKVGNGTTVRIAEETRYPFEDTIRLRVGADQAVNFPLYLRIPAWCKSPQLTINGRAEPVTAATGKFVRITREWKNGDAVTLKLPMTVSVREWTANHNSVSVDYGPLTFSLKIGERYDRHDSTQTAIGDSNWQKGADPSKWPSWEIHPTTAWNYGLVLDSANPESAFAVKHGKWPADDFPFTTDAVPITMEVKARKIPEWTLDRHGLCAVLQNSPVYSAEPVEMVSLIPMGAARLRISAFPVIGTGPGAYRWTAPAVPKPSPYKITASHCYSGDTVEALADGLEPANSGDESIPRHTWWTHRGTTEWVQYDFPQSKEVSAAEVYWFDDSGKGDCRVPKAWRMLYLDDMQWKPVPNAISAGVARDQWNRLRFQPVKTTALRIEAELQPNYSAGILEWRVK